MSFIPLVTGPAVIPFGVTFLSNSGLVDNVDTKTLTISNVGLGSYTGTKHIIFGGNFKAEPGPLTTVTIAGVTATIIRTGGPALNQHQVILAIAEVTGVTSGDIVVTTIGTYPIREYVYSVFEMLSGSITPTDDFYDESSTNPTGTLDIVEGGFAVAIAGANTSASFVWTGLTENYDRGANIAYSHAYDIGLGAETGRTITADPSGSPTQRIGIGASFGPA
jgi:hypothetical protein